MIGVTRGAKGYFFFAREKENRGEAAATRRKHTSRAHADAEKYQTLRR